VTNSVNRQCTGSAPIYKRCAVTIPNGVWVPLGNRLFRPGRTATAIPAAFLWSTTLLPIIGIAAVVFPTGRPTSQMDHLGPGVVFPYSPLVFPCSPNKTELVLSSTTRSAPGPEGARNSPSTKLETVERPPTDVVFAKKSPGNRQEPNKCTLHAGLRDADAACALEGEPIAAHADRLTSIIAAFRLLRRRGEGTGRKRCRVVRSLSATFCGFGFSGAGWTRTSDQRIMGARFDGTPSDLRKHAMLPRSLGRALKSTRCFETPRRDEIRAPIVQTIQPFESCLPTLGVFSKPRPQTSQNLVHASVS
jgi:hypothetical protein